MVGENNTLLLTWHWPRVAELVLVLDTSIIDTIILSIVGTTISSLRDPSRKIQELWGWQEEPNSAGSTHSCNVTPISDQIQLADGSRQGWHWTAKYVFVKYVVANKPMAHLAPWNLGTTIHWLTSPILQRRRWSTISGMNWMMTQCQSIQIPEAFRQRRQVSNSLNGCFTGELSDCSITLTSSETILLVYLRMTCNRLFFMKMWLHYASIITLWILPLPALWPIESVQPVTQLQISCCDELNAVAGWFLEDLHCRWVFLGTLEGGEIVGTDLSVVITWVGLGLCAAERHHFSSCVRVN